MNRNAHPVLVVLSVFATLAGLGCGFGSGGGGGGGGGGADPLDPSNPPPGVVLPEVTVPVVSTYPELVAAYEQAAGDLLSANQAFIETYQAYAMADPYNAPDFLAKTKALNEAGSQWIVAVLTLNGYAVQFEAVEGEAGKADGMNLQAPGVPVGLPFSISQLVGTTTEKRAQLQEAYDAGRIDENELLDMRNELKKTKLLETAGTALAAGSTVAGGIVVKAGLVLAGASGGILVGGTILGAAAIGLGVKFIWSYCSSGKSDDMSGDYCALQTHEATVGDVVPLQFPGNGTLIIQVDGHEPIVINNLEVGDGEVVTVDFEPGDPANGVPPGEPVVTPVDPVQFGTCEMVAGVTASPSPVDPAPYVGVTVTARTIPPVAGCTINFSIVGTDDYANSESPTSDASGTATFFIPGGAEGVVDTVTIGVGSTQTTVVYTF